MATRTVILTHGGCPDGVAAAHMFRLAELEPLGELIIYQIFERDFDKNKNMPSLQAANVYIVDISFPVVVLEQISRVANRLYVWDHHITTARDLLVTTNIPVHTHLRYNREHPECRVKSACPFELYIDKRICATEIVVERMQLSPPWYLQHIHDRDFYKWNDQRSKGFSEAFYEAGINLDTLRRLDRFTEEQKTAFYARGNSLVQHNARVVNSICRKAEATTVDGIPTYVVWSATFQSDIGNRLLEDHPDAMVWIIRYSISRKVYDVSMRANNIDVAAVARKYSDTGGGHSCAAGFEYNGDIRTLFEEPI